MLLAVDIGNTNIKFGFFEDNSSTAVFKFSVSSDAMRTADEYRLLIKSFLNDYGAAALPDSSVIASVVPHLTTPIVSALSELCKRKPFIIGTGTRTGFPIRIDVQSQLGADIVANAAAALKLVKPPFVVVDMGTATTITCVDSSGALAGTIIAPGTFVALQSLLDNAALLTDVPLTPPDTIIGKNSYDSVRSGAYLGTVYMIDGFIRNLRETMCNDGEKLSLVGTGGLSDILSHCRNKFTVVENLTLVGAAELFFSNL